MTAITALEKRYDSIESIKTDWTVRMMAAITLNTERPSETEEETFNRIQKEFICDLILFGVSLELVRNGADEYKDRIEYYLKQIDGNIRFRFSKQDLYLVANILLGNEFPNWGQDYLEGKPKLFYRIKDMQNLEYWLTMWINICCEMNEVNVARYLASNSLECFQYYKNVDSDFVSRLQQFLNS